MSDKQNERSFDGVAIIGMSGRFPGAENIDIFWRNLRDGKESIRFFTDEELMNSEPEFESIKDDPNYVRARGVLESADLFDAQFFGFNPKEASILDPQQRIWLECAWEALENAGYDPGVYKGSIGVFAGSSFLNSYLLHNLCSGPGTLDELVRLRGSNAFSSVLNNSSGFMTTRTSYKFNLKGPSVNVQTGCSTSLVAVCLACQSLLDYDSDICLAGGVSITFPQEIGYICEEGAILSPDGHCRPFDSNALGTVPGNGVGVVVLKRLEEALDDGDNILAIIRGSAINNDGSNKVSYWAPSVEGQTEVIAAAQAVAEVAPETITYIEAHGTATPIGDPVEIAGLTKAFRLKTDALQFCGIGSVKSNVGHLDAAAGVSGLIKMVLALKHKQMPPTLHFLAPNPEIDFQNSPFYVVDKLTDWETDKVPRRAGVSSFGIGGTNAHVVLEEAPETDPSGPSRPRQLLTLSARTKQALDAATANLCEHLTKNSFANIADIAYTLQTGRKTFNHRRFIVCKDATDAAEGLKSIDPICVKTRYVETRSPEVAFMFPGQGTQYLNMGLNLYQQETLFRETVDRCAELLGPYLGRDLREILYPKSGDMERAAEVLRQTALQQPAIFTIEYALARLWERWGVRPSAMIGHSIGEYVAACLAEVFSLEDALMLVATRGRMMQELPGGAMLSVRLPAEKVEAKLDGNLTLAAINAPSLCLVSGPTEAVEIFQEALEKESVMCRFLHTSHAFHSPMMDPIVEPFASRVKTVQLSPPKTPFVSTVTGAWIEPEEATDPMYWGKQLRRTVRFAQGIETLWERPERVLLEVGPRATSTTLARQQAKDLGKQVVIPSLGDTADNQGEWSAILNGIGQLWLAGLAIDWPAFYMEEKRHRVALPTYPFERKRFWIEPPRDAWLAGTPIKISDKPGHGKHMEISSPQPEELVASPVSIVKGDAGPHTDAEILLAKVWKEVIGVERIELNDNYFADLGGDSLSVLRVIEIVKKKTELKLEPNLFLANTLRQIAAHIAHQQSSTGETRLLTATKPHALSSASSGGERKEIAAVFFGESEEQVFGIYQAPRPGPAKDEGVLLCYPIGQEYMVSHWAFRKLSNLLSRAGFHVFRFDYFGTGDSAGQNGEGCVSRWKADIRSAAQELRKISKVENISAVGLRLGAALAAEACDGDFHLKTLVLWDPVVSGKKYIEELGVMHRRYYSFLEKQITESASIELLGFPFPDDMRTSIEQIDLILLSELKAERIILVGSEQRDEYSALGRKLNSYGVKFHQKIFLKGDDSKGGSRRWEGEILEDGLLPIKIDMLSTISAMLERESK